jgi:hypothetical protein
VEYPRWHVAFPESPAPWYQNCCPAIRLRKIEPPEAADKDFDWRRTGDAVSETEAKS